MVFAFTATDKLTGGWETMPSVNGNVTGVVFREDNTYEAYINERPFVSGTYSYEQGDNVFTLDDNGCTGMTGIYKINFFSDGDSIHFAAIDVSQYPNIKKIPSLTTVYPASSHNALVQRYLRAANFYSSVYE